ncbi:hypothetical protein FACS189419_09260 [Planctomycetales bacterium]|nr:hypothetical protein FACS189419_09260 [Planctomycetales bacterium]
MPLLNVTQQHKLSRDEATARLKKKRDEIKEKHTYTVSDLREEWTSPHSLDFSFKVLGFSVTGSAVSNESEVRITVDLPTAAMLMKGSIESQIRQELSKVLA